MKRAMVTVGYLCQIALDHEVGHDAGGTTIFWSKADWQRERLCHRECQLARVEIREVVKPKASKRKRAGKGKQL